MPVLPVDAMVADCDAWEENVVRAAFTTRGVSNGGRLRANKPDKRVSNKQEGCANYVWRMLCFDLVSWGKHACMPVCADFDLCDAVEHSPGYEDCDLAELCVGRAELQAEMNLLIKQVEAVLPVVALSGVMRWGRALGYVR
jgi:hypothetical protein